MVNHRGYRNATLHKIAVAVQVQTSELTSPGEREHKPVKGERREDGRDAPKRHPAGPELPRRPRQQACSPPWRGPMALLSKCLPRSRTCLKSVQVTS
jgi:hypothetical protein